MKKRIAGHDVIRVVADVTNTPMASLVGQQRYRRVARPRQLAAYLMRELCPHLSYPAIGRLLGGRDHSTIIHAQKNILNLIDTDADLYMAANVCRARLSNNHDTPAAEVKAVPFWTMCYAYERAIQLGREGRFAK